MFRNSDSHLSQSLKTIKQSLPLLTADALEQIKTFLLNQQTKRGAFINRKGEADLYYTVFGLICLKALAVNIDTLKIEKFLKSFNISELTMIDLCSYVKCLTIISCLNKREIPQEIKDNCFKEMKKFQTSRGAFSYTGKEPSFPYALFLAANFFLDLGIDIPRKENILSAIFSCRTNEGSFSNPQIGNEPMLLSTAAAIHVIRYITGKTDMDALNWIKRRYLNIGGFSAAKQSPLPDMLSTGVALFTLSFCGCSFADKQKAIRCFIDDHWDNKGGFRATLADDECDCEYTYYALLALGSIK